MNDDLDALKGRVDALEMLLIHALGKTHSQDEMEATIERMIATARKLNRKDEYVQALRDLLQVWRAGQ